MRPRLPAPRGIGICVCLLIAVGGLCITIVDGYSKTAPRSVLGVQPTFGVGYRCKGPAKRQLELEDLTYDIYRYHKTWGMQIDLLLTEDSLVPSCSVVIHVPEGSRDPDVRTVSGSLGLRVLTLRSDADEHGKVVVPLEPPGPPNDNHGVTSMSLSIVLPSHPNLLQRLGFGLYYFRFETTAFEPRQLPPPLLDEDEEVRQFGLGRNPRGEVNRPELVVELPPGHSFQELFPDAIARSGSEPLRSRIWEVDIKKDMSVGGTFQHNWKRDMVERASDVVLVSLGALLGLLLTSGSSPIRVRAASKSGEGSGVSRNGGARTDLVVESDRRRHLPVNRVLLVALTAVMLSRHFRRVRRRLRDID